MDGRDHFAPLRPEELATSRPEPAGKPELEFVVPVPDSAPPATVVGHELHGPATAIYEYRDGEGRLICVVERWDLVDANGEPKKEFRPLTFWRGPRGNGAWYPKAPPAPRPLYGLNRLAQGRAAAVLIIEGEKAADAARRLFPDLVAMTWMGGANAVDKADWSPLRGRKVIIFPDHDFPGEKAAQRIAKLVTAAGASEVRIVNVPASWPDHWDVADPLPDGATHETLKALLRNSELPRRTVHGDSQEFPRSSALPYRTTPQGLVHMKAGSDGLSTPVRLTTFTAKIVGEVERDDGAERSLLFEIEAACGDRRRRFTVPAGDFAGLGWATRELGAVAIIMPGTTIREHARVAIQLLSGEPERQTIYAHTGWREIGGHEVYLHGGGAIGPAGAVAGVTCDLPGSLAGFHLPLPPAGMALGDAVRASLRLLSLGPLPVTSPLFAAIWRAPLGQVDFTVFLVGHTGAFKSQLAALAQQHWGKAMNALALLGWGSTGNSLEALAFAAKDALLVIDDFAPSGAQQDVQRTNREAARVLRAQGNSQGRARCAPDGTLRPPRPPRGLILSTGEDLPGGHSIRARCVIVEVRRGDIDAARLTAAQAEAAEGTFALAMSGYLAWLAQDRAVRLDTFGQWRQALREGAGASAHRRTPWAVAELGAGLRLFLEAFAVEAGALSATEARALFQECWRALQYVAAAQGEHHAAEDPVVRFRALLAAALTSHEAHLADADRPQEPPTEPERWGWQSIPELPRGDAPEGVRRPAQRAMGRRIGWLRGDTVLLDPEAAYVAAQELARRQGGIIPLQPRTLWKRLAEAGVLVAADKGRNTYKAAIGQRRMATLALSVAHLLDETGQSGRTGHEVGSHRDGVAFSPDSASRIPAREIENGTEKWDGALANATGSTSVPIVSISDAQEGQGALNDREEFRL